ncbi:unnamed protein product [Cylicocyclus nassatus]|uniref:Uncharacterized protein n=1 Tax=Cylicocyclus nassatus TaxID=53992 RepID=A0AA36GUJ0_CYLNA|nr:unnamed protein product [Cylicocyclus nassatus]
MSAQEEEVRAQVKVVEDKEVELCIAHLRFLSKFYITVIENKRAQMNMAHTQFLANKEDYNAYSEWTGAKLKIIDLYKYWLRELLNISIVDDLRALCMHQMMAADCYWFLAKMHQPTFHFGHSNYEMACRCMVKILNALFDLLPQHNKFVIHLVRKYSLIVLDYRKEVGLSSPPVQSASHTSTEMHGRDLEICQSNTSRCRTYIDKLQGAIMSNTSTYSDIRRQILQLARQFGMIHRRDGTSMTIDFD